ncbi:hypothetical protein MKW98_031680, partial [Papaver atlanticum]
TNQNGKVQSKAKSNFGTASGNESADAYGPWILATRRNRKTNNKPNGLGSEKNLKGQRAGFSNSFTALQLGNVDELLQEMSNGKTYDSVNNHGSLNRYVGSTTSNGGQNVTADRIISRALNANNKNDNSF